MTLQDIPWCHTDHQMAAGHYKISQKHQILRVLTFLNNTIYHKGCMLSRGSELDQSQESILKKLDAFADK